MKVLNLTLKKKWFDLILSGEKTEEYRDTKDYWAQRLLYAKEEIEWQCWSEMLDDMKNPFSRHNGPDELMDFFDVSPKDYDTIHFVNGYGAARPNFYIELKSIKIQCGKEEWGAKKDKYYFVLELGKLLARS